MKSNYVKTIIVLLLIAAIVAVFFFDNRTGQKKVIYIAIVSSLTGDLAENGKDVANGAKLAIDQFNESNSIKIHYEVFDDQASPKMAVNIAHQISQNPRFLAVIGHLTSGCMLAAAPVYDRAKIPVVMPVPTNPKITQQGFKYLFRVPPKDDDQAPFLAKYLIKKDPKAKVAIVHDLTAYGMGFANEFKKVYEKAGGHIVAFEGAQKETRNFRALLSKLKKLNPQYVVLGATYDFGAPFVRQMKEIGLTAIPVSGDGCYGSGFLQQAGDAADGTIVSFIAPDRKSSPKTEKFFKEYENKYGKVVSFAPLGYDSAKVVIAAIQSASTISRETIWENIKRKGFLVDGVTGKIEFTNIGDNKNKNLVLYVADKGKFVILK